MRETAGASDSEPVAPTAPDDEIIVTGINEVSLCDAQPIKQMTNDVITGANAVLMMRLLAEVRFHPACRRAEERFYCTVSCVRQIRMPCRW